MLKIGDVILVDEFEVWGPTQLPKNRCSQDQHAQRWLICCQAQLMPARRWHRRKAVGGKVEERRGEEEGHGRLGFREGGDNGYLGGEAEEEAVKEKAVEAHCG